MPLPHATSSSFHVQLNDFEGSLDLLLSLIEKRKFFINDVALAEIADEYLNIIERSGDLDVDDAAGFLTVASQLVLMKSRSLLPEMPLSEKEKGEIEGLQARLEVYSHIRHLAGVLGEYYGKAPVYPPKKKNAPVVFSPTDEITPENLGLAAESVLERIPRQAPLPQAHVPATLRVEDVMEGLHERVLRGLEVKMSELEEGRTRNKADRIVTVIAILELVKSGTITARQNKNFDEIELVADMVDVPRY